ncbi:hypothetical protein SAMN02745216_02529 [Desulfatibacillum alkenivorans DSM 16219]|jgi:hypothetical protein|uniref:SMODS-associated and fused to various effectors domain-containing protein n=1 Tax=Desulfatibacillum alkenivorans DSM 16219 TaxID=1121393 RepID=A0A1M6N6J2_9BACT|nr:SAVED domain-containing protein [Desulfatibacillum alkenivorans]SHJ91233.1 hypothetical protein SAMN02745216_02529 [Desulfatibacillum alkenivorans DSM 16219]
MAQKQVGARTEGDVVQGLFFWQQAAKLMIPESLVIRVTIEHDEADGVDDVAVFYGSDGINAGGWQCMADYYQLKYHVDNSHAYSSDAIVDPAFTKAKSSLLQRFHNAYKKLIATDGSFRLHLVSNWQWRDDDLLAKSIRESDGALPQSFFTLGPRSDLGKIREQWRKHLDLDTEAFKSFTKTLRFHLNYFGRQDLKEWVNDRLARAGLRIPPADHAACPYESLVQKFLMDGPNSFDRKTFFEMCRREELIDLKDSPTRNDKVIGIRSFIRFAENIEEETDKFICVSDLFEGRHPIDDRSWRISTSRILSFLSDRELTKALRSKDHRLLLECHGSFAFLAGYEMSRNSGSQVFPVQKPRMETWKPDGNSAFEAPTVVLTEIKYEDDGEIAVSFSFTHGILGDVESYFQNTGIKISKIVNIQPKGGPGGDSLKGADHVLQVVDEVVELLRNLRSKASDVIHVFGSTPNAFMFFLGQYRNALGRLQLYEYDFGFERHCTYSPSILVPKDVNPDHGG